MTILYLCHILETSPSVNACSYLFIVFKFSFARQIYHNLMMYKLFNKEGNVLFNDTLNKFVLLLYGVTHLVMDHSDTERGNPLPPLHRLLFPTRDHLYATSHSQDSTYHGLSYTSRGALAGTRNSSMGPSYIQ